MAPHADVKFEDTSGYTPNDNSVTALKAALRLSHPTSLSSKSWISEGCQSIDSHDRDDISSDCVLQLSLRDLQEIEDAVAYFEGLCSFQCWGSLVS